MIKNSNKLAIFEKFLNNDQLRAADLGADGGICEHWLPYLKILSVDAFEPNLKECERQAACSPKEISWHPIGLAKTSGLHTLFVPSRSTGASLYQPNPDFIEKYGDKSYWGTIKKVPINCLSFSDFLQKNNKKVPNLIKLDTQGSELDILSSLSQSDLSEVLCVETEVEFQEIYLGQPLFNQVHEFMTHHDFELLDLRTSRAHFSKNGSENYYLNSILKVNRPNPYIGANLVAGDALYIRRLDSKIIFESKNNLIKLIICACIYHFFDLAMWLVDKGHIENIFSDNESRELQTAIISHLPKMRLRDQNNIIGKLTRKFRKSIGLSEEYNIYWMKREWPNL